MPFYFFLWTVKSIEHLSDHGVSQEEFEEVVMNPEGETISRSSGNPIAFGTTPVRANPALRLSENRWRHRAADYHV